MHPREWFPVFSLGTSDFDNRGCFFMLAVFDKAKGVTLFDLLYALKT